METANEMHANPANPGTAKNCEQIAAGVWRLRILFVNVYLVAADDEWVLVDAGLKGSAGKILKAATALFGDKPPAAVLLTHGHFDHVGALHALLQVWKDTPVYAHALELPYLTGQANYPPADPFAGGGMMSWMSFLYPNEPVDLGDRVQALPKDGSLPVLQKWRYVHTPGHAPGHVSLFRDTDRLLIVGDAFVTTRQESAFSVMVQRKVLSGPPRYFTYDWPAAAESVKKLHELAPATAASGHGKPMHGNELLEGLERLVKDFDRLAVPADGRYVHEPAHIDKRGKADLPPPKKMANSMLVASVATVIIGVLAIMRMRR